jgi:hypothetical protein
MTAPDARIVSFGTPPADPVLAPAPGFVCLPRAVLRAPGLSVLARLLYGVLLDYARQDGRCYPGTERLRADLGCGHNQLARALRELEAGGLVARRRRGFGKTTVYELRPLAGARPVGRPGAARSPQASVDRPAERPAASPPRSGRPVRPEAGSQRTPVRVPQDLEAEDQDAGGQQPPTPVSSRSTEVTEATGRVVALLVELGVTAGVARGLAARYDPERIRRQVACHRHRVRDSGLSRNPAGALVRAIVEDWAPPVAWTVARERAAVHARRAEEEARRRAEEDARRREWEQKPPEERIAGRLQFWLLGRRRKGHEPSEPEIAARRAELLAELGAPPPAAPGPAAAPPAWQCPGPPEGLG